MAETLGSLCDKLTIVKLKQWHTIDKKRIKILKIQEQALRQEIDEFVSDAFNGSIPMERLKFEANKVYKKKGNAFAKVKGDIGAVFSQLAQVNCELWHEVEKSYDIDQVPDEQKGVLVRRLAVLNLERNRCMEAIDENFQRHLLNRGRI
jgi:preprotein translocase subunit SecA